MFGVSESIRVICIYCVVGVAVVVCSLLLYCGRLTVDGVCQMAAMTNRRPC